MICDGIGYNGVYVFLLFTLHHIPPGVWPLFSSIRLNSSYFSCAISRLLLFHICMSTPNIISVPMSLLQNSGSQGYAHIVPCTFLHTGQANFWRTVYPIHVRIVYLAAPARSVFDTSRSCTRSNRRIRIRYIRVVYLAAFVGSVFDTSRLFLWLPRSYSVFRR